MEFEFHPNEFKEEISDATVALEAAVDALDELVEHGASRSLMAGIESLEVGVIDDRYPVNSFTQLPSKVNYRPAMESVIQTLFKAISGKQTLLFAAIGAAIAAIVALLNKIMKMIFNSDTPSSSDKVRAEFRERIAKHNDDMANIFKHFDTFTDEDQKAIAKINFEIINLDFSDPKTHYDGQSAIMQKANTQIMHWAAEDREGLFGQFSVFGMLDSVIDQIKELTDHTELLLDVLKDGVEIKNSGWYTNSSTKMDNRIRGFPIHQKGWIKKVMRVLGDKPEPGDWQRNQAAKFPDAVQAAAKKVMDKPVKVWADKLVNMDFEKFKEYEEDINDKLVKAQEEHKKIEDEVKKLKEPSPDAIPDEDKELLNIFRAWSIKISSYAKTINVQLLTCGSLLAFSGIYYKHVNDNLKKFIEFLRIRLNQVIKSYERFYTKAGSTEFAKGFKIASKEFADDYFAADVFLTVFGEGYEDDANDEVQKKIMEKALAAGRAKIKESKSKK